MNGLPQGVDSLLDLFNPGEMVILALVSKCIELAALLDAQFMRPLEREVLAELSFAQMRELLLHIVEIFVLKKLVGRERLLRNIARSYLSFELRDLLLLGLRE